MHHRIGSARKPATEGTLATTGTFGFVPANLPQKAHLHRSQIRTLHPNERKRRDAGAVERGGLENR